MACLIIPLLAFRRGESSVAWPGLAMRVSTDEVFWPQNGAESKKEGGFCARREIG
jgi:hypothetical protein